MKPRIAPQSAFASVRAIPSNVLSWQAGEPVEQPVGVELLTPRQGVGDLGPGCLSRSRRIEVAASPAAIRTTRRPARRSLLTASRAGLAHTEQGRAIGSHVRRRISESRGFVRFKRRPVSEHLVPRYRLLAEAVSGAGMAHLSTLISCGRPGEASNEGSSTAPSPGVSTWTCFRPPAACARGGSSLGEARSAFSAQ